MVGHMKYKNELPQENQTKKGRPFRNSQGTRTGNLSIKASFHTWKIHPIFHVTLLRQYKETDVYGANFPRPPLNIIKGEEV